MLDKRETIDQIEIKPETGHIQVRKRIDIIETVEIPATDEDGKEITVTQEKVISYTYERFVIEPEQDIDTVPEELRAIVEVTRDK
jgi:hypothetical protein